MRFQTVALIFALTIGPPVLAQEATSGPSGFTSPAQAEAYLDLNPAGPRAGEAFRLTANAEIASRNPDFDPAQIAAGSALILSPGASLTAGEALSVIDAVSPGLGAAGGWF